MFYRICRCVFEFVSAFSSGCVCVRVPAPVCSPACVFKMCLRACIHNMCPRVCGRAGVCPQRMPPCVRPCAYVHARVYPRAYFRVHFSACVCPQLIPSRVHQGVCAWALMSAYVDVSMYGCQRECVSACMRLRVYVTARVCVGVCVSAWAGLSLYGRACMSTIFMSTRLCVRVPVFICVRPRACVSVHVFVCMCPQHVSVFMSPHAFLCGVCVRNVCPLGKIRVCVRVYRCLDAFARNVSLLVFIRACLPVCVCSRAYVPVRTCTWVYLLAGCLRVVFCVHVSECVCLRVCPRAFVRVRVFMFACMR